MALFDPPAEDQLGKHVLRALGFALALYTYQASMHLTLTPLAIALTLCTGYDVLAALWAFSDNRMITDLNSKSPAAQERWRERLDSYKTKHAAQPDEHHRSVTNLREENAQLSRRLALFEAKRRQQAEVDALWEVTTISEPEQVIGDDAPLNTYTFIEPPADHSVLNQ